MPRDLVVGNGSLNDTVHPELNLLLRKITVENNRMKEREIRLFLHHDFRIQETDVGDTAFFHPFTRKPLTWSHAAFVTAVSKYQAKVRELATQKV